MVPIFGKSFGHFHTKAVQDEIVLILVLLKQFSCHFTDRITHGHNVERCVVFLARLDTAEEVGNAEEWFFALAWVVKATLFSSAGVVGVHHKIGAVGIHGEVAVHHLRQQHATGFGIAQLLAQQWA